MIVLVDVWVRVCSATDVTRAGVEDVVEVEVDEVVDEVVLDEVAEVDLVVDDEVVLPEDVDDALDVLLVGVGIELDLGKRTDTMPNCLSWNS